MTEDSLKLIKFNSDKEVQSANICPILLTFSVLKCKIFKDVK